MRRLVVLGLSTLFLFILNTPSILTINTTNIQYTNSNRFKESQEEELTQHNPISITNEGEFSQLGFPGSGIYEDPYVIEDWIIELDERCIFISNTSSHFRIQDCVLKSNTMDGTIQFENVINGVIKDCVIEGGEHGINLVNCTSIDIEGSKIVGQYSCGIVVGNCYDDIVISNNRIFETHTGIYIGNADYCIININRIYCNSEGIHLTEESSFNQVFQNSIGWNANNAYDVGFLNTWHGNYWSDCPEITISYGIGGGISEDVDAWPLTDTTMPVINAPDIGTVIQGNASALLSWTIIEAFPMSYEIYQNSAIIDEGYLTRQTLIQPLGSLPLGEYIFTIVVRDGVGNIVTLQRIIDVVSPSGPDYLFILSFIFSIGIVTSIMVILPLDYRRRKRKYEKNHEVENEKAEEENFDLSELLE
ncbi:MAG: NosD domain-containing protein [Candidatus Thorarchaeota archaeon]